MPASAASGPPEFLQTDAVVLDLRQARMISTMTSGEDNPFVIKDGVQWYQTVLIECAEAEKARLVEGQDAPSKD
jgi:hypothetical protein